MENGTHPTAYQLTRAAEATPRLSLMPNPSLGSGTTISARAANGRRVLLSYAVGLITGLQAGLYLFDLLDDGVADWRSGLIALVFLGVGAGLILRTFRRT